MIHILLHKIHCPGLEVWPAGLSNQSPLPSHVFVGFHPGRSTPGARKQCQVSFVRSHDCLYDRNLSRQGEMYKTIKVFKLYVYTENDQYHKDFATLNFLSSWVNENLVKLKSPLLSS